MLPSRACTTQSQHCLIIWPQHSSKQLSWSKFVVDKSTCHFYCVTMFIVCFYVAKFCFRWTAPAQPCPYTQQKQICWFDNDVCYMEFVMSKIGFHSPWAFWAVKTVFCNVIDNIHRVFFPHWVYLLPHWAFTSLLGLSVSMWYIECCKGCCYSVTDADKGWVRSP